MPENLEAIPPVERSPQEPASQPRTRRTSLPRSLNWRTLDPSVIDGDSLRDELMTYRDHLPELLAHSGDFVLIKGSTIIALFSTLEAALEAATERFGAEPALIKQITAREAIHPAGGLAL